MVAARAARRYAAVGLIIAPCDRGGGARSPDRNIYVNIAVANGGFPNYRRVIFDWI
jgi:hypothetical protein